MIVSMHNQELRLPDFFIVGAAKSATTSLHSYLKQHPQIHLPDRKELYFFAFNGEIQYFKLADGTRRPGLGCTREEYFKMYQNSPQGCISGDTSSWYLYYYENVIKNIQQLYGSQARKAKIIMILRNPVERAWSHYSMHYAHGINNIPFREAISNGSLQDKLQQGYFPGYDYIGFGMYSGQVEAYLAAFDDVKIIMYEDINNDTHAVVNEVIQFLGLEPVNKVDTGKRLNVSGKPRSPLAGIISRLIYKPNIFKKIIRPIIPRDLGQKIKMEISRFIFKRNPLDPKDRQVLIDIYRDDILRLQKLLDRDLSKWLQSK
ncbi:MAG: sulfotransferase [Candidatus Aminicenantes bacterium]|nr:MAG: sulfotransferase [Candidatus Aminicenantes bacterium]